MLDMNIAGKGVLLLGVFVAIGIIVLSEGFSDTSRNGESLPVIQSAEESSQPSNTSEEENSCLLYTSPSPRDQRGSRMPSSA